MEAEVEFRALNQGRYNASVPARRLCLLFGAALGCFGQHETKSDWIRSDAARLSPPEVHGFLELICPGNTSASGCAVCPQDTSSPGGVWNLRAITLGHFVSPASEDVLISGFGCESHADGWSGTFLFTKDGSSWRRVRYLQGMNAFDCKKLPGSDDRDRLVCAAGDMHFGVADSYLYLLDPGRDPATLDPLDDTSRGVSFFAVDDSLGGCVTYPKGFVQSEAIDRVEFMALPTKHHVRIAVFARLGKAMVPEDVLQKACESGQPDLKLATVSRRYEFIFNGRNIVPLRSNPSLDAPRTSYSAGK
jgi:hypothetical protein